LTGIPEHNRLGRLGRAVARRVSILLLLVITVTILSAVLVRLAPGFGMDESQLDLRLSNDSVASVRTELESPGTLLGLGNAVARLAHGDWGVSLALHQPVRELFLERSSLSLRTFCTGLFLAWTASFAAAVVLAWLRRPALDVCAALATGAWLCLPAAVIAVLCLYFQLVPGLALSAILIPRIFRYTRNILQAAASKPYVLAARARGVHEPSLMGRHICQPAAPELLALAGISISMAVSAMIPVEALCDSPGIGQLVWQSAAARDLPVLIYLTVLIAVVTCVANLVSDTASTLLSPEAW